ncbi:MAG: CPBP family intramembrane metalloprotease [Coriobacteriales bacterium]|nr:CPBP family intramembrane metalloprotease [Coriobacteriales bacterium]
MPAPQPMPQPMPAPQPMPQPMPQMGAYPPSPGYQPYQQAYASPAASPYPYPYPYPSPYQQAPVSPLPNIATTYKKKLRRVIMLIVLALFLFYIINGLATSIMGFVSFFTSGTLERILSNPENALLSSQDLAWDLMQDFPFGEASILGIITGSLALLIVRGKKMFTEDLTKTNNRIHLGSLALMTALILGINAIFSLGPLAIDLLLQALDVPPLGSEMDIFYSYLNVPGVLYVVILGPIFEEIIFRGAIMRSLQPYGNNFAIVLSSLLFGAYHLILFQGIFAFFVGMVLAYCALRFSIKWSMLLHIINNGFAMALMFADPEILIVIGIYLALLAVGIVAAALGFRTFQEGVRAGKPASISSVLGIVPGFSGQPSQPGFVNAAAPASAPAYAQAYAPAYAPAAPVMPAEPKARPFAIAFSSPWLIVALSLAFLICLGTLFM